MRFVFTLLAMFLAATTACKKSGDISKGSGEATGSNAVAGSSMAGPPAAAGSSATGSGEATGPGVAAGSGASTAGGSADTTGAGSAGGSPAIADGSGSDMAAAAAMAHRAGMCPSTVLGATTRSALTGKAVIVTVESDDKDAIAAIQKRAEELLAEKRDASTGVGHDRKGTHGGAQGLCPVYVPEGAKAAAEREPKGVVVTITPKDKPDELAKEIDIRISKAAAWVKANVKDGDKQNQGGVGGGKGEDGSNHSGKGDGKGHERRKGGGTGGGGGARGGGSGKRS